MSIFQGKKTSNKIMMSSKALWAGVIFSFLFTGLIWLLRDNIPPVALLPDQGPSWYYWKLPKPTFWTRATAWGGYMLHQVAIWGLIYYAQKTKIKYTSGLHRLNIAAFAVNAIFIVLHLLQTQLFYDGLAQDVSIWSSQASVVLMLIMILLMENQRRGLFFGKKVGFLKESARVARKYHGYIFAWGIIYTFWYHPMETTVGHLMGFLYTFFLLVQGSLMFTRAHLNKWWTFVLEISVLVHGTVVAVQTTTVWPMFLFGFAGVFVVTQMYGLGLNKWWRWGFIAAYIAGVVIVYSGRGWGNVNEILRIPVIEYLLVFILALIIWLGMLLVRSVKRHSKKIFGQEQPAAPGD